MRRVGTSSPGAISFPQSDWHGFQPTAATPPPPYTTLAGPSREGAQTLPNGRRVFQSANKWASSTAAKDISAPDRDAHGAPISWRANEEASSPPSRASRRSLRVLSYATQTPSASLEELFHHSSKYDMLSPKTASPTGRTEDPRRVGQRTMYNLWSDSFDHDLRQGITSAGSLAELTYCSMIAATSRRGSPAACGGNVDALRVAGAALIIDKILGASKTRGEHVVTISCSLLNLLKTELLNGVYVEHSVDVAQQGGGKADGGGGDDEGVISSPNAAGMSSPAKHLSLRPLHHGMTSTTMHLRSNPLQNFQPPPSSPCYIDMTLAKEKLARLEKQLELFQHKALTERQHDMNSTVLAATRRMMTPDEDDEDSGNVARSQRLSTTGGVWDVRSVAQLKGHCKRTNLLVERLVFNAWKNSSKTSARRASAVHAVGLMVVQTSRTMILRVNFRTWIRWARERHAAKGEQQKIVDDLTNALAGKDLLITTLQSELRSMRARCEELEHMLNDGDSPVFGGSGSRTPKSSRKRFGGGSSTAEHIVSEKLKVTADDVLVSPRVNGRPVPQFTLKTVAPNGAGTSNAPGLTLSIPPSTGDGAMTSTLSEDTPLKGVEGVDVSAFLVEWVNAVVACTKFANDVRLTTVDGGLVDGTVYVALMCYLFPQANFEDIMECRTYTRLQYIVQGLEEHGLDPGMITQSDITNASISNWCVLAWLFHHWYNAIRPILKNYDVSEAFSATSSQAVLGWCVRALSINRMFTQAFATLNLRVTAFVMRMMTRRIRAAYQAEAEGVADKADFVNIKIAALSDIAGHIDAESEVPQLVHLLNAKYELLHPIYEFYRDLTVEAVTAPSSSGGGDRSNNQTPRLATLGASINVDGDPVDGMLASNFLKMCQDSKLQQRAGLQNISAILPKYIISSNFQPSDQLNRSANSHSAVITKGKFVELLVRFAALHLMAANGVVGQFRRGEVASTLQDILANNIFPYAMVSERKQFRRHVAEPRVVECFVSPNVQRFVSKIYRLYATTFPPGHGGAPAPGLSPRIMLMKGTAAGHADREEVRPQLSKDHFIQFLTDLKLLDKGGLTKADAIGIFRGVQREEAGVDEDGVTMNQNEFQDALVAISMIKMPSPFQPLHTKVSKFLNEVFVPAATVRAGNKR